jgi:hypothetical protein
MSAPETARPVPDTNEAQAYERSCCLAKRLQPFPNCALRVRPIATHPHRTKYTPRSGSTDRLRMHRKRRGELGRRVVALDHGARSSNVGRRRGGSSALLSKITPNSPFRRAMSSQVGGLTECQGRASELHYCHAPLILGFVQWCGSEDCVSAACSPRVSDVTL